MPRKPFPCAECGEPMQPGSTSLPEGQAKHGRCKGGRQAKPRNIECIVCKQTRPLAAGMKCHTCYSRQWRQDNPDANNDIRRRRRARQANATIEHFTSTQVFDRDNWTCQHCQQPVHTYKDSRYHADRATLDHIKPLAKGGEHSLTNTQCLCHHCNGTKGATYTPA